MQAPPKVLYHYTDANALIQILSNLEIWVSSLEFLNDTQEFKHTLQLCKEVATSLLTILADPEPKARLERFVSRLDNYWGHYAFVFSLSSHGDLLSLWRGYSGNGAGYSIGFDFKSLSEFAAQRGMTLRPCIYERSAQVAKVQPIIEMLRDGRLGQKRSDVGDPWLSVVDAAILRIREDAPFFKHAGFSEEGEWRLLVTSYGVPDSWNVRSRANSVVPYLKVDLGRPCRLISEIFIGPGNAEKDKTSFVLINFIQKLKLTEFHGVRPSGIPFRNW